MRARSVVVAVAASAVLPLTAGGLVEALASPATPAQATPPPKSLQVSDVSFGPLFPGAPTRTASVTVTNPSRNGAAVAVRSVNIVLTGDAQDGDVQGCKVAVQPGAASTDDLVFTGYTGPPVTLESGGSATFAVSARFVNRSVVQDSCKNIRSIPFNVVATAAGR